MRLVARRGRGGDDDDDDGGRGEERDRDTERWWIGGSSCPFCAQTESRFAPPLPLAVVIVAAHLSHRSVCRLDSHTAATSGRRMRGGIDHRSARSVARRLQLITSSPALSGSNSGRDLMLIPFLRKAERRSGQSFYYRDCKTIHSPLSRKISAFYHRDEREGETLVPHDLWIFCKTEKQCSSEVTDEWDVAFSRSRSRSVEEKDSTASATAR